MFSTSNNNNNSNGNPKTDPSGNQNPNQGSGNAASHSEKEEQKPIRVNEYIDQTVLKAGTRWEDVRKVCNEAYIHDFPAVCIPPCFVKEAKDYLAKSRVKIATVIGFPFGNTTTEVKVYETRQAIENGADEIDMVINIGWLKQGDFERVGKEV